MSDNALSAGNQQERLPELTPEYVVGIVDGEGYFSVTTSRDLSKNYKSLRVRLVFGVDVKETDERILYELRDFFNCGNLSKKIDVRPKFSNQVRYQVRNYQDIKETIIPFFQKYPLRFQSKRDAFERFMDIARRFEAKQHLTDEGFEEMRQLAKTVHGRILRDYTPSPLRKQAEG